jgi:hypothetical protein
MNNFYFVSSNGLILFDVDNFSWNFKQKQQPTVLKHIVFFILITNFFQKTKTM